jgi:ankyrin repeat protein
VVHQTNCEEHAALYRLAIDSITTRSIGELERLLDAGMHPGIRPSEGERSLLITALAAGFVDEAILLIKRGATVCALEPDGIPPLTLAARLGQSGLKLCRALLDAGAAIDETDKLGRTALFEAARWQHMDVAHFLLERGADEDICSDYGGISRALSPAQVASTNWSVEPTSQNFRMRPAESDDVFDPPWEAAQVLCAAAARGLVASCQSAIARGANVNMFNPLGALPLTAAVQAGGIEVCRLLVNNGANLRQPSDKANALSCALQSTARNSVEILRILYLADKAGQGSRLIRHFTRDEKYLTPLQYAVACDATDNVALLLDEFGEDPNEATADGVALIDLATSSATREVLRTAIVEHSVRRAMESPLGSDAVQTHGAGKLQRPESSL